LPKLWRGCGFTSLSSQWSMGIRVLEKSSSVVSGFTDQSGLQQLPNCSLKAGSTTLENNPQGRRDPDGRQRPTMAVPAGCWERCTESRWPLRPPEFSFSTAGAEQPGSAVPWSQLPRSAEGFFPEATPQVDLCCTLVTSNKWAVLSPNALGWGHLLGFASWW
jgi:hypothetical protein